MQIVAATSRFWLFWGLVFLGFPIAGVLSNLLGQVNTPVRGLLAGLVAGAVIGIAQWLVLRSVIPVTTNWVVATSLGMGVGLALATAFFGSETSGSQLLIRAAITGLIIGLAQWFLLRTLLPQAFLWPLFVAIGWIAGWFVTRSAGVDLSFKWSVFGASGALAFQLISGIGLYILFRISQIAK